MQWACFQMRQGQVSTIFKNSYFYPKSILGGNSRISLAQAHSFNANQLLSAKLHLKKINFHISLQ